MIGQTLTSNMVINQVEQDLPELTIQGADLSLDNAAFSYKLSPQSNELYIFNYSKILVVENT
jgi:hypothetical protein